VRDISLWPRIADLELAVERVEYDVLEPGPGFGEAHANRLVRLTGAGAEGLGEDITLFMGGEGPDLELAGEWTLAGFCDHLHALDQWPDGPPESHWEMAARFRNWAFESAALDLALRQAGQPLHAALGRAPRPVTYVNSLGLGDPPDAGTVLRRLERYPKLRFKLDAAATWTPEIVEALVRTRAVHTIDFKGQYGLEVGDVEALARVYSWLLEAFPEALLEDPHDLPEITPLVREHAARVAYDAPIVSVAALDATTIAANVFNIKPSRVGRLETLLELYAECERRGALLYGGGMAELGVARGQVQLLASLFSPDGPNDIAPPGFNALEPAAGLPLSPLDPAPAPAGFRRAA
jgi:L-alanine-DL-glutamate epimerase-like enolase superfamily enzyme